MKRAIIALGCLLVFTSGWAFGQTKAILYNGTGWKMFGSSFSGTLDKTMYITGLMAGFQHGFAFAEVGSGHKQEPKATVEYVERDRALADALTSGRFAYSYGQITSEMDSFYSDYRNAPVCWDEALDFSLGALEGHPLSEPEVNAARAEGAKAGCR